MTLTEWITSDDVSQWLVERQDQLMALTNAIIRTRCESSPAAIPLSGRRNQQHQRHPHQRPTLVDGDTRLHYGTLFVGLSARISRVQCTVVVSKHIT